MTNRSRYTSSSATQSFVLGRLFFVIGVAVALILGLWAAWQQIGWDIPQPHSNFAQSHGGLLVVGVFGTFITLQRSIVVSEIIQNKTLRLLPYVLPVLTLLSSAAVLVNFSEPAIFAIIACIGYAIASGYQYYRQRSTDPFLTVIAGLFWFSGNAAWLSGDQPNDMALYWIVFLILTFGEEQYRRGWGDNPSGANLWFIAGLGGVAWGSSLATSGVEDGFRLMGLGEILIALWFFTFDTARQPDNRNAPLRPIAACLFSAFFWLAVSGILGLGYSEIKTDHSFEAFTHTLFIGFGLSMLFAHTPHNLETALNIVPQLNRLYVVSIGLLNAGMVVLLIGDLIPNDSLRQWGGALRGIALTLFLINIGMMLRARHTYQLAGAKTI